MFDRELQALIKELRDLEKLLRRNDDRESLKKVQRLIKVVAKIINLKKNEEKGVN